MATRKFKIAHVAYIYVSHYVSIEQSWYVLHAKKLERSKMRYKEIQSHI